MTNLEKSIEISEECWIGTDPNSKVIKAIGCLTANKMAEWKDSKFKENIEKNFGSGLEIDGTHWSCKEIIEKLIDCGI